MVVHLSIGSNLGDRRENLLRCLSWLKTAGRIKAVSSLYETAPMDMIGASWFFNAALSLDTDLEPDELLKKIKAYEAACGRNLEQSHHLPRIIDIDILFLENRIIDMAVLKVPHPHLIERAFVLVPLAEIAPDLRHPVVGETVSQILSRLPPGQQIRRLPEEWVRRSTVERF